ncbi:MAG: hypothetical protein HOP33_09675 [Verrucomicrobia bacterium]|nr:hypothetical protein [Verrucomicrobiota bacterium]
MKNLRRVFIGLGVILAVGYFAIVISLHREPATFPPLPIPNGYDDFTNAVPLVTADVGDAYAMDLQALQSFVRSNAAALKLVRTGLSRECLLPTEAIILNFTNVLMDSLPGPRRLAQLLNGEGRLAELEGRTNDAARSYIHCIRLGNEVSRGGVLINRMVGMACEAIGCSALARIAPKISREQSVAVVAELMAMETNAMTWNEVITNEKAFMRHARQDSFNPIRPFVDWWQSRAVLKGTKNKHDISAAKRRLIAVELALRIYQIERGQPPTQLSDLVPRYLPRIPIDPFAEKELIYRPQGTNWLLYSVGEDGMDDGGTPATGRNLGAKGDVLFNAP